MLECMPIELIVHSYMCTYYVYPVLECTYIYWITWDMYTHTCVRIMYISYVGKIWRGEILANLVNDVQFAKFFHANSYKYSEITEDLPADSPKFSSPLASSVMIRQKFPPPNGMYIRTVYIVISFYS